MRGPSVKSYHPEGTVFVVAKRDRNKDPRDTSGHSIPKANLGYLLWNRGMSQAELGRHLGVEGEAVGNWISGRKHMANEKIVETAALLHVSIPFLLDLTDDEALDAQPEQSYSESRDVLVSYWERVKKSETAVFSGDPDLIDPVNSMPIDYKYEPEDDGTIFSAGVHYHWLNENGYPIFTNAKSTIDDDWVQPPQEGGDYSVVWTVRGIRFLSKGLWGPVRIQGPDIVPDRPVREYAPLCKDFCPYNRPLPEDVRQSCIKIIKTQLGHLRGDYRDLGEVADTALGMIRSQSNFWRIDDVLVAVTNTYRKKFS
jgi:transcriptional regulator with XRE-family HTH domain